MAHSDGNDRKGGEGSQIPRREPPEGTGSLEVAIAGERNPIRRFLKILGPGFISGAADDDPSGIGTYATAGASLGFATLWTALLTFPLMAAVQFVCAKIGMVTGKGLAGVLRQHYPRWLLYAAVVALFVANTINVGADLAAVAAAINLLVPSMPIAPLVLPIALGILVLQVWGSYRLIARIFKWLTLALFAYIGSALFARPHWGEVLSATFIPTRFDQTFLLTLVAILGTTISPYLFFWQATQEVEEEESMGRTQLWRRKGATDTELRYAALDVNTGMFFSILVMYFIMLATAATLHQAGKTDINSATDAAEALRPLAGNLSSILLAVGLIGSGVLAIPILSGSAAYALSEAFGWRYGLDRNPGRAKQFYAVIVAATLVGVAIDYLGINPIDALFFTAVINGFVAPPLLVLIMLVANNGKIMGKRTNSSLTNVLGWGAAAVMFLAAGVLVLSSIRS
ncbi:MAG: divalent metal cation transporter [Chloroflexota bacterium]|nr:divalent metal cation transporter [Chloroflexota bacterium]